MWKYNGKGFKMGLPTRDLTDQEAQALGIEKVKSCGLYDHVSDGQRFEYGTPEEHGDADPQNDVGSLGVSRRRKRSKEE